MILVDSSVWIDYFKGGAPSSNLSKLIELNLAGINEIILSELVPVLRHRNEHEVVRLLNTLPRIPLDIFWIGIREMQCLNLTNGINKVGIPNLIIAQQCILTNTELWSFDKHFKLMSEHFEIKIFSSF